MIHLKKNFKIPVHLEYIYPRRDHDGFWPALSMFLSMWCFFWQYLHQLLCHDASSIFIFATILLLLLSFSVSLFSRILKRLHLCNQDKSFVHVAYTSDHLLPHNANISSLYNASPISLPSRVISSDSFP